MTRRGFLALSGGAAVAGVLAYSAGFDPHHLEVTHCTVELARLPRALDGLRIAQLSDVHYEQFTQPSFIREAVAEVNRQAPDLMVLTGDYVSEGPRAASFGAQSSYPCADILSGIQCAQRWCVLGNHDVSVGAATVMDALHLHGLPVLQNRHVPFERDGARLWIAGVKNVSLSDPDMDLAVPRGLGSAREPVILLAHEPDYAGTVMRHGGVDLMLSGHTHGGQIRLPMVGALYTPPLGRDYIEGHFQLENGLQLYVNRGIGTSGVPFRVYCRPELTMITLRSPRAA
ncbi:MAG: metallophosphoesterase [Bryocella sp.]